MHSKLTRWIVAGVLLAVACLGLRYRWMWLIVATVGLTVAVYLAGIVRALVMRGRQRTVSLAFVLVGISYMLLATGQLFRETMPTQYALALLWKGAWQAEVFIPSGTDEMIEMTGYEPGNVKEILELFSNAFTRRNTGQRHAAFAFVAIGHCVLSWLFAAIAGWFAGRMYDRRTRTIAGNDRKSDSQTKPASIMLN
jgi:hypothetical protein